ncbi:MAG: four helix bundle suffix domain-containing protein [Prevotella sp.]|nr:four helix bundle suffix domain-containing protein [Prevotella sp.]
MKKVITPPAEKLETVLRKQNNWKTLWFYQKTVVLYQMTYVFTRRFLPAYGDRTVDQMVQAARSGKQNIIEGSADGVTSMEMELKLLNVARASIQELLEDYEDYLPTHHLVRWTKGHHRFNGMLEYCKEHNHVGDYAPFFEQWTDEEAANIAITLCKMVDKMMMTYQKKKEEEFVTEGGIRERMTAARLGYRTNQRDTIEQLQHEVEELRRENDQLKEKIKMLGEAHSPVISRSLNRTS